MSVEPRDTPAGRRYVVRWREEGKRRARHFVRKRDAEAFDSAKKVEMRERRELGGFARTGASSMLLGDYIAQATAERAIGWEENTRIMRAEALDTWVDPLLGHVPLRECAKPRIRQFRNEMSTIGVPKRSGKGRRKASNNRVNSVVKILSAFLGFAVEDGLIPENPCLGIKSLPHVATKHKAWDPVILEQLRAQMRHRDRIVVSLMYLAGLRPQEALGLHWRNVREKTLLIERATARGKVKQTKTRKASTVELLAPLAEDLAAWRAEVTDQLGRAPDPDSLVIMPQRGSAPLHLSQWRQHIWHGARRAAGLPEMTPYDCRHTFGSLLIHEGMDVLQVARLMRHANPTTTLDHYAHEFDEWQDRDKRKLVDVVAQARAEVWGTGGDDGEPFEPGQGDRPPTPPAGSGVPTIDGAGTKAAGAHAPQAASGGAGGPAGAPAPTPSPSSSPGNGTQKDHKDAEGAATGDPPDPHHDAETALHHPAAHAHAAHDCRNGTEDYGSPELSGTNAAAQSDEETSDDPPIAGRGPKKDPPGPGLYTILRDHEGNVVEVFSTDDERARDRVLAHARATDPHTAYLADTSMPAGEYGLLEELLQPAVRQAERKQVDPRRTTTHLRDHHRAAWMLAGAR